MGVDVLPCMSPPAPEAEQQRLQATRASSLSAIWWLVLTTTTTHHHQPVPLFHCLLVQVTVQELGKAHEEAEQAQGRLAAANERVRALEASAAAAQAAAADFTGAEAA